MNQIPLITRASVELPYIEGESKSMRGKRWLKHMRTTFGYDLDPHESAKKCHCLRGFAWDSEEVRDVYEAERLDYLRHALDQDDMTGRLEDGKVYIKLFHGRYAPDEELEDWGFDGPIIGPVVFVHTTYHSHIHVRLERLSGDEPLCLGFEQDMLAYDGCFYGDWSVFVHRD